MKSVSKVTHSWPCRGNPIFHEGIWKFLLHHA